MANEPNKCRMHNSEHPASLATLFFEPAAFITSPEERRLVLMLVSLIYAGFSS